MALGTAIQSAARSKVQDPLDEHLEEEEVVVHAEAVREAAGETRAADSGGESERRWMWNLSRCSKKQ